MRQYNNKDDKAELLWCYAWCYEDDHRQHNSKDNKNDRRMRESFGSGIALTLRQRN